VPGSLEPLLASLRRHGTRLWLRDDDACDDSEQLHHLLTLCAETKVPLLLAVIPALATEALARRLHPYTNVQVAAHGWQHHSHAPAGEKNNEYAATRDRLETAAELAQSYHRCAALFAEQFSGVFVPPWNRFAAGHFPALHTAGFSGFSAITGTPQPEGLLSAPVHADWLRWQPKPPVFVGGSALLAQHERYVNSLQTSQPWGLLTHHRVQDDASWQALETLFRGVPTACWQPCPAIAPVSLRGNLDSAAARPASV
jgi:hypothetical protein